MTYPQLLNYLKGDYPKPASMKRKTMTVASTDGKAIVELMRKKGSLPPKKV